MRTFKIFGRVVDSKTKSGIEGLRVEAWDKDLLVSDLVGGTTTGDGGVFRIQFDESHFKELFLDRRPDLFFKVFRGDKLIKDTKDSVLWNVDREDIEMRIEVEDSGSITPVQAESDREAATRSILQATYTPRKPRPEESMKLAPQGLMKAACIARLRPSQEELRELADRYAGELKQAKDKTDIEAALRIVETISTEIAETGQIHVLNLGRKLAVYSVDAILSVAKAFVPLRRETLEKVLAAHVKIQREFAKKSPPDKPVAVEPPTGAGNVRALMEWAVENKVERELAPRTLALGKSLFMDLEKVCPSEFQAVATRQLVRQRNRLRICENNLTTEAVGYLHLEKMSFTPAGIEHGGLVYSVPLSPGEEVNIKHREWSHTSEEFERIVTDYMEEFSEEGVAEKTELAQSVNSQSQHSTAFNTSVSTSGEAYGFSITASVGYNASESASRSEQLTRNHSTDITHKASSRSKKEHKITFRVASARETEDETVQRIKNPFPDRATRVDYYQLLRKWQIDLYRYGIRFTYDILVAEPGCGLLSKIAEIRQIQIALETGVGTWIQTVLGLTEPLGLHHITPFTYVEYAAKFNTVIEGVPPLEPTANPDDSDRTEIVTCYKVFDWHEDAGSSIPPAREEFYEIEVPQQYLGNHVVLKTYYEIELEEYGDHQDLNVDAIGEAWPIYQSGVGGSQLIGHYDEWNGRTLIRFPIHVWETGYESGHIEFEFTVTSREDVYRAWQLSTLNAIQEAAQTRYYEHRQQLKDRLARLKEELGAEDALSLRKKEREEVMKGVLVMLGFPPEDYRNDPRVIRFLHHAIEWENMLYFLYPYFWSDPDKELDSVEQDVEHPCWEFKKYLDHPDPIHRAFLKSGYARVVITIRPGFEDAVMALLHACDMDGLPPHPYLEIGSEFQAYAKTNYAGIPPANPIENYRPLLTHMQKKTWERMRLLIRLLEIFHQNNHRYPETAEGLITVQGVFPMKDPWGNDYVYTSPGQYGEYDLASLGADGAPGGVDQDSDITSWEGLALPKDSPEQVQAWEDIQMIMKLLEEYYKGNGHYPSTQDGLEALKELILLEDAWEREFVYECPGRHGEYDLCSRGADGEPGGKGENADITNWAEASLIGQWFEYTPTSALDIAFDAGLPSA